MPGPARKLSGDEIGDRLRSLRGWEIKQGKLSKAFTFDDFMGAVEFVNRIFLPDQRIRPQFDALTVPVRE